MLNIEVKDRKEIIMVNIGEQLRDYCRVFHRR